MNIGKDEHLETLIGSINKMFANARNKGVINNKEITLINLIYKLLKKGAYVGGQEQKLLSIYYKLLNRYSFLCKAPLTRKYYFEQTGINSTYIPDTCYDANKYEEIFYWQESDYQSSYPFIADAVDAEGYLLDKPADSYQAFEEGKEIDYSNIGRICFLAMESNTLNYAIRDCDGILITDSFDIVLIPSIKATLMVSKNVISHGNIKFKIKKL